MELAGALKDDQLLALNDALDRLAARNQPKPSTVKLTTFPA